MNARNMACFLATWLLIAPVMGQDANDAAPCPVKKLTDLKFKHDSFTFVRHRHSTRGRSRSSWATDYPDSDRNLTARVAADLGLKTDPEGKVLDVGAPELKQYPLVYMAEPGRLELSDTDIQNLRIYLRRGGFLLVDDFWGRHEWDNFHASFQKVFPDRPLEKIAIEHPIFHCFYDLAALPQVPSIHAFSSGAPERPDAAPAEFWGLSDDKGRLMVLICHNTDLGDGWERAGEDARYFREISQRLAYPMGVNVVVYALTDRAGDVVPQRKNDRAGDRCERKPGTPEFSPTHIDEQVASYSCTHMSAIDLRRARTGSTIEETTLNRLGSRCRHG